MINKIASEGGGRRENQVVEDVSPPILDLDNISFIKFHENIEIVRKTGIEQVYSEYSDDVTSYLTCGFGVLLFLYSVMLTRVRKSKTIISSNKK